MNLLKSSNISDLQFVQSEDYYQPEQKGDDREPELVGKKLLDSSWNNRLEPTPKHAFRPYTRQSEPEETSTGRPNYELEFNIEENRKLGHSSFDFMRLNGSNYAELNRSGRAITPIVLPSKQDTLSHEPVKNEWWLGEDREVHSEAESEIEQPVMEEEPVRTHPKNYTKNIPKNYGKAIITFIERNKEKVNKMLYGRPYGYNDIMNYFRQRKRSINTIEHLRELWMTNKYAKYMRILSKLFLRKHALHYIFNSRISNYSSHIKYRHKLLYGVSNPRYFSNIKDY